MILISYLLLESIQAEASENIQKRLLKKYLNNSLTQEEEILLNNDAKSRLLELSEFNKCLKPFTYLIDKKLQKPDVLTELKSECKNIKVKFEQFGKKKLYIGFATEYLGSPISSFGHSFFLLSSESGPRPLDSVIEFNATFSQNSSSLSNILLGLFGGLQAGLQQKKYYKKIQEYQKIEQREILLFEVDLTNDQYLSFLLFIIEFGDRNVKYTFAHRNCAKYMNYVLEIILGREVYDGLYFTPIELIENFKINIEGAFHSPSLLYSINKKYVEGQFEKNTDYELAQYRFLKEGERDFEFREIIGRGKYEWNRDLREFIFREKNYTTRKIEIGGLRLEQGTGYFLDFFPVYNDLLMNRFSLLSNSEFLLFNGRVHYFDKSLYIEGLSFFKLISLNDFNLETKIFSWGVDLGWKKQRGKELIYKIGIGKMKKNLWDLGVYILNSTELNHKNEAFYLKDFANLKIICSRGQRYSAQLNINYEITKLKNKESNFNLENRLNLNPYSFIKIDYLLNYSKKQKTSREISLSSGLYF